MNINKIKGILLAVCFFLPELLFKSVKNSPKYKGWASDGSGLKTKWRYGKMV
jgi:hypothetical protein